MNIYSSSFIAECKGLNTTAQRLRRTSGNRGKSSKPVQSFPKRPRFATPLAISSKRVNAGNKDSKIASRGKRAWQRVRNRWSDEAIRNFQRHWATARDCESAGSDRG